MPWLEKVWCYAVISRVSQMRFRSEAKCFTKFVCTLVAVIRLQNAQRNKGQRWQVREEKVFRADLIKASTQL